MKVLSTASARPNFVKLAAVHHALKKHGGFEHIIVHTGQHYDPLLSDVFFQELNIDDPKYNLGIKGGGSREEVIATTAAAMEEPLKKEKPDIILVYGDVNGAVGAARAAKKLGIRIGHVEAGLRSGDTSMPEELNRTEIDSFADLLFITEVSAQEYLKKEKVKGTVHFVGNTMIDTLVHMLPKILVTSLPNDLPKTFGIATLHRPSNVDSPEALKAVLGFLKDVSVLCPIVFPLHRRTQASLDTHDLRSLVPATVTLIDPLGYLEFLALVSQSSFILTDSGGIQEEATFLKKRCFTLRRNTERPSTIVSGSNVLIDPMVEADRNQVLSFAKKPKDPTVVIPEKWDGKAGERIAGVLTTL